MKRKHAPRRRRRPLQALKSVGNRQYAATLGRCLARLNTVETVEHHHQRFSPSNAEAARPRLHLLLGVAAHQNLTRDTLRIADMSKLRPLPAGEVLQNLNGGTRLAAATAVGLAGSPEDVPRRSRLLTCGRRLRLFPSHPKPPFTAKIPSRIMSRLRCTFPDSTSPVMTSPAMWN